MPVQASCSIISGESVAGPIVQTILVCLAVGLFTAPRPRRTPPGRDSAQPRPALLRSAAAGCTWRPDRCGRGAGLDLAAAGRDREVGDGHVLGLARAVRHHCAVACAVGEPDRISVSVSVPIWFTLTRMELAHPSSIPRCSRSTLVTNRSSPTSWTSLAKPLGQQLASRPSRPRPGRPRSTRSDTAPPARRRSPPSPGSVTVRPSTRCSCRRCRARSTPDPARSRSASRCPARLCRLQDGLDRLLARRPGRARIRLRRRPPWKDLDACSSVLSAWNVSTPIRSASEKLSAPTGTTMNSCRSMVLSAWAPPLITFIIGTGRVVAVAPPR